jgi:hypothetical protein
VEAAGGAWADEEGDVAAAEWDVDRGGNRNLRLAVNISLSRGQPGLETIEGTAAR